MEPFTPFCFNPVLMKKISLRKNNPNFFIQKLRGLHSPRTLRGYGAKCNSNHEHQPNKK